MRTISYKLMIVLLLLVLVVGFAVFRWSQGPRVSTYSVSSMPLVQTVVATGRVITTSRTQIGSEVTGVVLERLVEEGDKVAKGDLLLVLSSEDVAAQVRQAQAELSELTSSTRPQAAVDLANAEVALAQARRDVERRRELAAIDAISDEEMEQALQAEAQARNNVENARLRATALSSGGVEEELLRERIAALQAQLNKAQVRSEVSGTVLTRDVEPGDLVQPGRTLFTIAQAGSTEIQVPLDERNLSKLALQQAAVVIADAYPNRPFAARINFIAPSINAQNGTVEVRLAVDPVPEFLRQDMTVSVNVETDSREQALVIPNDAFIEGQDDQAQVMLVRDGRVQRQIVTLGLRGLTASEVVSGLNAGDQVLTDATSDIEDGTKVRVETQRTFLIDNVNNVNNVNNINNINEINANPQSSNQTTMN
ncbi:efflux RND transporter periplasmic adaptor subunit [Psychrobacter jeotgali]|uniref:efflux RND transporter periplasmic adaptor subunit n=1 Tax=Psychrobacter jeotgali TaxID=179010 RepID=UPI001919162E|nr:efflux RND transporter periplasmic adaptor subunit [Psychrobacter jeotgali]